MADAIKVDGLAEFSRSLKKLDTDLPKALRVALNEAADVVVSDAKRRVPTRTGRAQRSIKARSTRTAVRIAEGGTRAPYMPWLDFGGRVGRNRSVVRPFRKEGRYLYAAYFDRKAEFGEVLTRALLDVARQAGVEVE
ncbi:MAG TPA: HK97 gp10 family phage protein [Kribbellaceae bacterium]|nr:HK97 gp10 family phage protein [Kribbellaceae bacterium]